MTKLRINVQSKGSTKRIPLTSPKQHSFDHSRDRKSSTLKLPGAAGEKRKHHPVHGNPLKWKSPLKWLNREAEMSEGWIGWSSPYSRKKRNGRGQGSLQSVLVAVIGAVLLGTLLGLSIMALFFSGDGTDISARSIDSHLQSVPVDEKEKESEVNHKKKVSNSKSNGYRLPELKAVLVQTGTFKKKSGALKTVREYRSEGSGAVITENSPYRIYRGIGLNQEEASHLSAGLKEKKSYLKELRIADQPVPVSRLPKGKKRKELTALIQKGHHVFQIMGEKTSDGLRKNASPVSFQSVWSEVIEHYSDAAQSAQKLEKEIPGEARPYLVQMIRALDQVVQNGQTSLKQSQTANLWQIQEGLIRYALAYKKFVHVFH